MRAGKPAAELPRDFVWGVSTASYQIEGAATADGRGPSVWDTFSHQPDRVANGDTGDIACDHYHRWPDDIGLMRDLGIGAYRFSIAWPRLLPSGTGQPNEAGLAFYDRLIDGLLAAGIEPWICLYHWDLPQALQDRGGWTNRDSASWFADYAALIGRRYGDRVGHFATFNEPALFSLFGYVFAWHAPGLSQLPNYHAAVHHVNLAHGSAVDALRATVRGCSLGSVHNVQPCRPGGTAPGDHEAAQILDAYWNRACPDPQFLGTYPERLVRGIEPFLEPGDLQRIARPVDWFGLNHYSPIYAIAKQDEPLGFQLSDAPAGTPRSPIGWEVDPGGFRDTLLDVHRRYRRPVYVMENGAGAEEALDAKGQLEDRHRVDYYAAYTAAMQEAVGQGADVRGYFAWSLLDNFEWNSGYKHRFGFYFVDYATQRRVPKASAIWYRGFIANHARRRKS